jgi:hypothetical protein
MTATVPQTWHEANQRYLSAALEEVRGLLEAGKGQDQAARQACQETARAMPAPAALETLVTTFGLSPFERHVLLMCAGVELDSSFPALLATAQGDPLKAYPSFSLALSALPEAHWSALSPNALLRRWRLVELDGTSPTQSPLRIDERILHYLTGVSYLDERLAGLIEPVHEAADLVPSHQAIADRLAAAWTRASPPLPVIQLCGDEPAAKRAVAASACTSLGLNLSAVRALLLPTNPAELEAFMRLWEREAALGSSALFIDCDSLDNPDGLRETALDRLIETARGALLVGSRERRTTRRPAVAFDIHKPSASEQRQVWRNALGVTGAQLNGAVDALVAQFNLSAPAIQATCAEAMTAADPSHDLGQSLWHACRVQARARLDDLAQRLEPAAHGNDLVLPRAQRQLLQEISVHVRQRTIVYETWGFAAKGSRGLGISALFAGPSGTGKTMAAEVLAGELDLDLYRIDLSQVVSKYIGETEKNLRRVFDAAETGGAILLFDEADALFGKRSEVKDSHDRYANIEVSYLLQRMEAYRGLAILTTNLKESLDTAFLRRIRFAVPFPFPDAAQRAEIWQRIFPAQTPTESLKLDKLARLNVTGGNIRNIALYASFLAAEEGEPVHMRHLLRAARAEYGKLERPLTDVETRGWL